MTTTGDGLLQAIISEPDDDALRLIYADWLADHGEPERAEFIRVEVAWGAYLDDDGRAPQPGDDPDFDRLDARRTALLDRHAADWFGEIGRLVPHHRTRRGFVASCDVAARRFVERADEIVAAAPLLDEMYLDRLGQNMPAVAARPELARFREVAFYDTTLGDRGLGHLLRSPHLARLRSLGLSRSRIGPAGATALAASPALAGLETLHLASNPVDDAGAGTILAAPGFARIRRLGLNECGLTDAVVPALAVAANRVELRYLGLGGNALTGTALERLAGCDGLASLRTLELFFNPLGDGVHWLGRFRRPPALEELQLGWVDAPDAALAGVLRADLLRSIRRLTLSGAALGPAALAALETTPQLAGLSELVALACGVGPVTARRLAALSWPALRCLRLSRNPLGAAGVRALAAGPLLEPVTTLWLGNCDLDDDAAEALASAEAAGNLRRLILLGNRIGERGALALARSPHLGRLLRLSLAGNAVTPAADAALRERFGRAYSSGATGPPTDTLGT